MLNIKIETVVNQIVRQELVEKNRGPLPDGAENIGLYMNFDCRLSHYTNEKTYNESCGLHLLYHCIPGGSVITVFSGVTDSPFDSIKTVKHWKHECSHDSCWRDIGVFSNVYFDMARKINEAMLAHGLKDIAPKDMHENNSFNGFDKVFSWVKVNVSVDKADKNRYRKVLELL